MIFTVTPKAGGGEKRESKRGGVREAARESDGAGKQAASAAT